MDAISKQLGGLAATLFITAVDGQGQSSSAIVSQYEAYKANLNGAAVDAFHAFICERAPTVADALHLGGASAVLSREAQLEAIRKAARATTFDDTPFDGLVMRPEIRTRIFGAAIAKKADSGGYAVDHDIHLELTDSGHAVWKAVLRNQHGEPLACARVTFNPDGTIHDAVSDSTLKEEYAAERFARLDVFTFGPSPERFAVARELFGAILGHDHGGHLIFSQPCFTGTAPGVMATVVAELRRDRDDPKSAISAMTVDLGWGLEVVKPATEHHVAQ